MVPPAQTAPDTNNTPASRFPPAPPSFTPAPEESRRTIRLLLIDDDDTLRGSCASVLTNDGYDVTVCGQGRGAQALGKHPPPHPVGLDWASSEVPGQALLAALLAA